MKLIKKKASTSNILHLFLSDSASTTGAGKTGILYSAITAYYTKPGDATATAITPADITTLGTYVSGGFKEYDSTNMPGVYEFHPPDACFTTADSVLIMIKGTGFAPLPLEVQLSSIDLNDAVRAGLTSLPNAAADAAGGLPISDAGGLDLDLKLANTNEVTAARMGALTDWINGGRLDLLLDAIPTTAMRGTDGANTTVPDAAGTAATPAEVAMALTNIHLDHLLAADYDPASKPGVATALLNELVENDGGVSRYTANALEQAPSAGTNPNVLIDTTIAAVTDQTHFTLTAGSDINDAYKDQALVVYDASNNNYPSIRKCSAYTGATKTVTLDSTPDFTIVPGDGTKTFVTAPGTTAPTVGQIRTEMEGVGTKLTNALDDTNELQTNQGNWATATATALSAQGKLDVNAECDTALTDYGANKTTPPTVTQIRTEMDTNSTKMAPSQTLADYKATGFNTVVPDAAGVVPTAVENRQEIDSNSTQLAAILSKLLKYVQLLARSDAAIETDNATELTAINADGGSGIGNFSSQTDAGEAVRDQGDSAWITATGFNTIVPDAAGTAPTASEIRTEMEGAGTKLTLVLADTNELQTDNIPGTLATIAGYLDTEIAAILADTNELQTNQGNWATATGFSTHNAAAVKTAIEAAGSHLALILADTSTDGVPLTAAAVDAILDEVIEGSLTMRHVLRLFLSALGGKSAGGGTATLTFRDNADTKARITATVDSSGNRTGMTLDGS